MTKFCGRISYYESLEGYRGQYKGNYCTSDSLLLESGKNQQVVQQVPLAKAKQLSQRHTLPVTSCGQFEES